jgi:hypothetical protein
VSRVPMLTRLARLKTGPRTSARQRNHQKLARVINWLLHDAEDYGYWLEKDEQKAIEAMAQMGRGATMMRNVLLRIEARP